MAKSRARKAMINTLLSGFTHHSHEVSSTRIEQYLEGKVASPSIGLNLLTYSDVLAPEPFRAMQNGAICLVTIICRIAIDLGVGAEQSFSLSDYYVCEVERQATHAQLNTLIDEMLEQYAELVREEKHRAYSLPVTRAIRYIQQHIFESCEVSAVAQAVGLNAQYFSSLFKKEVGSSPSAYIRQMKMKEAYHLLTQESFNVTQAAEAVGYSNISHFIGQFKKIYGKTPKQMLRPRA